MYLANTRILVYVFSMTESIYKNKLSSFYLDIIFYLRIFQRIEIIKAVYFKTVRRLIASSILKQGFNERLEIRYSGINKHITQVRVLLRRFAILILAISLVFYAIIITRVVSNIRQSQAKIVKVTSYIRVARRISRLVFYNK